MKITRSAICRTPSEAVKPSGLRGAVAQGMEGTDLVGGHNRNSVRLLDLASLDDVPPNVLRSDAPLQAPPNSPPPQCHNAPPVRTLGFFLSQSLMSLHQCLQQSCRVCVVIIDHDDVLFERLRVPSFRPLEELLQCRKELCRWSSVSYDFDADERVLEDGGERFGRFEGVEYDGCGGWEEDVDGAWGEGLDREGVESEWKSRIETAGC